MDPKKHRAIASMGGRAAYQLGLAHEFTSEEAKAAGAKGGKNNTNRHKFTAEERRRRGKKGGKRPRGRPRKEG
jgi:hypothetical protein